VLHELLSASPDAVFGTPEACLAHVHAVRDAYTALDRGALGADRSLELKFAALHWRRRLISRLDESPPAWLTSDDNTLAELTGALQTRLPGPLISRLSRLAAPRTRDYLLAIQGRGAGAHGEYRALAGPDATLNIRANRDSAWPFERWKRKSAFSRYEFSGVGVNYRGIRFLPGDILLANVNLDGNGVYTALSEPTRFSSHAAVFAILEDEDGRYPAVLETYEKGVRAVPLNVFLGEGFCAYVEVYRHEDLDDTHAAAINNAAFRLMTQARGYNFDSTDDDRDYVSCCTVGRLIHADAGLEPVAFKSRIEHSVIRENLERLGYTFFDFFAPVDYLIDGKFRCIGWVDNGQFEDLLARELVEGHFRKLFMTRRLNPARLPYKSRLNHWGIGHIRRQSLIGRAIGLIEGFDDRSLPKGPDQLLALITIVEARLGRAIKRTRSWVRDLDVGPACFSLHEFIARPDVQRRLESELEFPWLE